MQPVSRKRWRVKEQDPGLVECLVRELGLPELHARLIVNRGMSDPATVKRFLAASLSEIRDPFLLLGMEKAVARLSAAIHRGERICVFGDYDVDGISATALLMSFFRAVDADCFYHIPKRLEDGYGLSRAGIERVASLGAKVVVSVDCGITAGEESLLCSSLGMELIITDHHAPGPTIPTACAVINPHQPGCTFPCKSLAGVGVAFYLLIALRSRLRDEGRFATAREPDLRDYLDLVALGTVADVVPLVEENRVFVKHGLDKLTGTPRIGIRALKSVAGITGPVTCGAVGFRLAPRLNAAGRLEDAALGVELLLCEDAGEAAGMAALLDDSNRDRQQLEQNILADVLMQVQSSAGFPQMKAIVLASPDWHPGVIGIVASRMVELFYRPTILISLLDGSGKGSGRSIPGFNLYAALEACAGTLVKFGGHKYAAGLSLDQSSINSFRDSFAQVAEGLLSEADLIPELAIDAELHPEQVTLALADELQQLLPFGIGNPEPTFLLRNVAVLEQRVLNGRHLKVRIRAGKEVFDAIGFNMAESKKTASKLDLVFCLESNEWNGRRIQLRLKDLREAQPGVAATMHDLTGEAFTQEVSVSA